MTVRKAGLQDIKPFLSIAERFHAIGPYKHKEYDADAYVRFAQGFMGRSDARIYINDHGAIGVSVSFTDVYEEPFARENFLMCDRAKARDLYAAFDAFKREHGLTMQTMSALSIDGKPTLAHARLYGRMGFEVSETVFVRHG